MIRPQSVTKQYPPLPDHISAPARDQLCDAGALVRQDRSKSLLAWCERLDTEHLLLLEAFFFECSSRCDANLSMLAQRPKSQRQTWLERAHASREEALNFLALIRGVSTSRAALRSSELDKLGEKEARILAG